MLLVLLFPSLVSAAELWIISVLGYADLNVSIMQRYEPITKFTFSFPLTLTFDLLTSNLHRKLHML